MTTFLSDTFTDTNGTALGSHTGETGATWTQQTGAAGVNTIQGNALYGPASGNGIYYCSGVPASADYTVTAPFTFGSSTWPSIFGVGGRMSTSAQTGYFGIWFNSGGFFQLYKYVAGTLTQIGSDRTATKAADTFTLSLIMTGTTIALRVQRSSDSQWLVGNSTWSATPGDAISATDSAITAAGRAGMWLAGTNSNTGYMGSILSEDSSTASMTASPTVIATNGTGIEVTLTGTSTAWTGGTTFTVSGVTGVSKTAQNVASGTSATITLTTGSSTGTLTISDGTISTTVTVTGLVSITDANVYASPWNWYSDGAGAMGANNVKAGSTFIMSNNPGAYVKTKLDVPSGGGTCYIEVTTAHHTGFGSAANWPTLQYTVDSGAVQTALLSSGQTQVSLGSLSAGEHTVVVWFKSIGEFGIDLWNGASPPNAVKLHGFSGPAGIVSAAPSLRTNTALFFGDSITAGFHNLSADADNDGQNAAYTWAQIVAVALDAEAGIVGFGGQADSVAGIGNVPVATTSYALYSAGKSRLVAGLFSPAPDYIIVNWGENGVNNANYTTLLANIRTAAPSAVIFLVDPFNGNDSLASVTLPSGNSYRIDMARNGDLLDTITGYESPVHPDIPGSANIAARLVAEILPLLGSGTGPAFGSGYVDAIYMGSTQIA